MPLRIILADDHPVVLLGARTVIESSGTGEVVAEANSTDELHQALKTVPCDVLVTDFAMPGGTHPDGISMIGLIRRQYPELPILLLSMANNVAILRTVAQTGVLGLFDKNASMSELPAAIQSVHRGTFYMSATLKRRIDEIATEQVERAEVKLSPRETEVLRLLAGGATVKEISTLLNRSITTISRQKGDAMRRLGVRNDAELFAFLKTAGF